MKAFPARASKVVEWTLALVGVWALGFWAAVFIGAKVYQAAAGRQFSRTLRAKAAGATVHERRKLPGGAGNAGIAGHRHLLSPTAPHPEQ